MYPVPGLGISTPYGKRGSNWSCNRDSNGNGIHTGVDFACGSGTRLIAAIPGTIRHRSYGSAFGYHQFAISPDPGQPYADGEVFYAHTRTRLADGTNVNAGDFVAESGSEGNVTGPHLHFELHTAKGTWNCGVCTNPQGALDYQTSGGGGGGGGSGGDYPPPTSKTVYLSKLKYGQEDSDSVWYLQDALNAHPLSGGATLPTSGNYFDMTDAEVIKCQTQHGFGADPAGQSYVGPSQASHLFAGRGLNVVNDTGGSNPPDPSPPVNGAYPQYMQTWLHDALVAEGCNVIDESGWQTRTRPPDTGPFDPKNGFTWHHTAATSSASNPFPSKNILINGRPDLGGPLCHLGIDYNGGVHLIAAGRANHSGATNGFGHSVTNINSPQGGADGNAQLLGIEIDYDGNQNVPSAAYVASIKAGAAFCRHQGWDASYGYAHHETSTTGKIDPAQNLVPENMTIWRGDLADALTLPPGQWPEMVPIPPDPPDPTPVPEGDHSDTLLLATRIRDAAQSVIDELGV